ncbi:MAG: BrnA antitoxin family protein [Bauldia sp.]
MNHIKTVKKFRPGRGYTKADWDAVDSPELTDEQIAKGKPFKEALPELYEAIQRSRGRPPVEKPKQAVTLRIDPDTLARFRATGKDWRARMARALDRTKA